MSLRDLSGIITLEGNATIKSTQGEVLYYGVICGECQELMNRMVDSIDSNGKGLEVIVY